MVDDGWVEDALLQPLPTPPPEWIVVPGALKLAVTTPPGETYRWEVAVAVAWAVSPVTGTWAVLLAWEDLRRGEYGRVVAPRRAWCRYEPDQCGVMQPTQTPNPWGMAWFGRPIGGAMARAVDAAVASLPERLRETAAKPMESGADLSGLPTLRRVPG